MLIVEERKHGGKLKFLKMHDLLRDLCLREAQKLKFLCVLEDGSILQAVNSQHHILSRFKKDEYPTPLIQPLESASLVRMLFGIFPESLSYNFRLLRVVYLKKYLGEEVRRGYYDDILCGLVNLRLIMMIVDEHPLPSSFYFLWNLQTLVLFNTGEDYVCEIWKMPQLRHVSTVDGGTLDGAYCIPDHFNDEKDMMLEDLQSLRVVSNLKFGEGVLERIPNIKTLKLYYDREVDTSGEEDHYRLNNLCWLQKLETLRLCVAEEHTHMMLQVSFPHSLKKLTLEKTNLPWEDMKTKIGSLPLLQVLKMKDNAFSGSEWETCEDQFLNLKFLLIEACYLERWITDNTHFPRLEHLHLRYIKKLTETPSCMGDIPTLRSIKLKRCSDSVSASAQTIKEEQQELGNQDLRIIVT